MKLVDTRYHPRPYGNTRVEALIEFASTRSRRAYWFEMPEHVVRQDEQCGDPWLVLMMPLAFVLQEDIHLTLPVDNLLKENMRGLQRLWLGHSKRKKEYDIDAPISHGDRKIGQHSAMFFSRGVDSMFTLLRHGELPKGTGSQAVRDLIAVKGLDFPLSSSHDFAEHVSGIADLGRVWDKNVIPVATNIMHFGGIEERAFNLVGQTPFLMVIAYLLSEDFKEVLISSTYDYGNLGARGASPLMDALFSSRYRRVVHDGAAFKRFEKVSELVRVSSLVRNLHVCERQIGGMNCGKCGKCMLTMATLDVLGGKEDGQLFPWNDYSVEALARMPIKGELVFTYEVINAARELGRRDIVRALKTAVRQSRAPDILRRYFRKVPMFRRFNEKVPQVQEMIYKLFGVR